MPTAVAADRWLDQFFDAYYRHRPVNATFIGVRDWDDRLPDYSNNGIADVTGGMWNLLREAESLDLDILPEAQRIDIRLATGFLRVQLWEFGSKHFQGGNPSLYTSEAVFGPLALLLRQSAPLGERLDAARARFERIPALLAQSRQNVNVAPGRWIAAAIRECDGGMALAWDSVPRYLELVGGEHPALLRAALEAGQAFEEHQRHLREMLAEATDQGYGCGPDALATCIRAGHHLGLNAAEIADYGRGVMEECRIALERGASEFGVPTWRDALALLADVHPEPADYLPAYQRTWDEARASALDHELVSWPDYPIRYVERYEWVRQAAPYLYFLYYRAPSAFDAVDVVDYLVEPLPATDPGPVLRIHNSATIKLNHVVHHGGIGHHIQNWHAYRAESWIGRIAAVDCASRIAMFCGGTMAEGWSCYTTDLMDEFGFCTPLERFSQLHGRLRMAARAVVDVELHAGSMTLNEAIELYQHEVGMSAAAAENEAVKNSMNPGAALMYLTGADQIHQLRRELVGERTGADLRAFHDQFLSYGSIPVSIIADAMRAVKKSPLDQSI